MAQVVEHILGKDEVSSSNLLSSSKKKRPFSIENLPFLFFCKRFLEIHFDKKQAGAKSRGTPNGSGTGRENMTEECKKELHEMLQEINARREAVIQEWLKTHERPLRGRLAAEAQRELDKEEKRRFGEILAKYKDK